MKFKTVDELYQEAFDPKNCRDPRSGAYKLGVKDGINFIMNGVSLKTTNPYTPGSAESDAWDAGIEEGKSRALSEKGRCCDEHEDCREGRADPCCNDHCDSCERK